MLGRGTLLAGHMQLHVRGILELGDLPALPVVDPGRHLVVHRHVETRDVVPRGGELERAHHLDRHALGGLHDAGARAGGAVAEDALPERRPNPLPGHLDQAERARPQDLRPGTVPLHGIVQRLLDTTPVFFPPHVDEVVDDHAAEVAEPQLPGDLLRGDQVHLVGVLLRRLLGAEAARVDVDRHERLGGVDHDRTATLERHLALVDAADLLLEPIAMKERLLAFVELQP